MAVPYFERYHPGWSSDSVRLIPTASDTAKKLYFYIQECGYFRTDSSYYTERENLNSFLVILTLTGCGELNLGGETYELSPGRACLIHCAEHHFYRCRPGGQWEFLWIHFNGSCARGYYEEFVKNGYHLLQCRKQSVMERSLRQIVELHTHTDATTELLCSRLITDILTEFLADTCAGSQSGFALPDAVWQTRRYIDRHFREPLSLDELAARMHLSKYYLSHIFKKYVGVPVNEYIIRSRISYAKELLRFSSLSVNEITYEVGMNQPSYFIRTFKERESMTPSQFRRQWSDL